MQILIVSTDRTIKLKSVTFWPFLKKKIGKMKWMKHWDSRQLPPSLSDYVLSRQQGYKQHQRSNNNSTPPPLHCDTIENSFCTAALFPAVCCGTWRALRQQAHYGDLLTGVMGRRTSRHAWDASHSLTSHSLMDWMYQILCSTPLLLCHVGKRVCQTLVE